MIQFEHVSKQYAKGKEKALDDLTLHVGKGKVFGFIGPNGAGKTTTIKLLTGILNPTAGRVLIGGVDMSAQPGVSELHGGHVRCGCSCPQGAPGKVSGAV